MYGKIIPGLMIDGKPAPYPVINERAVRATAGIMFLIGISAFFTVFYTKNYQVISIIVPLFWLEFFLKVVFSPRLSLFGILGRWMVRKQKPEYVGVIQKRFAWTLGLILATAMAVVSLGFEIRGVVPMAICLTCLTFMYLETAFGICVGCKIYQALKARGFLKSHDVQPACPGGACAL